MTNPLFGREFCVVQRDTFYLHQNYQQVNSYKNSRSYIIGRSPRDEKVATYFQLAQKWNLPTKIWQNLLFYQHFEPLYDVMQNEIEKLEFVQGVNFEFLDSLKNNGTKYLLIFDDS